MKTLLLASLLVLSLQLVKAETAESQDSSSALDGKNNDLARLHQEVEELKKSSKQEIDTLKYKIEQLEQRSKQEADELKQSSEREIEEIRSSIKNSTHPRNVAAGGAVYTRWGRTVCPIDATLVYKGFMTSGHFASGPYGGHTSSYVCLAYPPEWATYSETNEMNAELYAVQYYCADPTCPFSLENNGGESIHVDLVPCAVCQASAYRPVQVMIAAMRQCPAGWNFEYNGYLGTESMALALIERAWRRCALMMPPKLSLTVYLPGMEVL